MAVVLTLVQTQQIRINIHKRNNTKHSTNNTKHNKIIITIIVIFILLTAVKLSLGGSNSYTSTYTTNKNKYT